MTDNTANSTGKPRRDICDFSPARAILGKCITGVMLKRRVDDTKHPENRMFLMFDDGTGFECFTSGPIFPWNNHRDCDYKHVVRHRLDKGEYATVFFAGEPEGDDKKIALDALFKQKPVTSDDNGYDKSKVAAVIGKRISGTRLQTDTQKGYSTILDLLFTDGTIFEFRIAGRIFACSKPETFDLYRLPKRGQNAYESEVLVLKDPDGDGNAVVINELYRWPTGNGEERT